MHLDELGDLIGLARVPGVGAENRLSRVIQPGSAGPAGHLANLGPRQPLALQPNVPLPGTSTGVMTQVLCYWPSCTCPSRCTTSGQARSWGHNLGFSAFSQAAHALPDGSELGEGGAGHMHAAATHSSETKGTRPELCMHAGVHQMSTISSTSLYIQFWKGGQA